LLGFRADSGSLRASGGAMVAEVHVARIVEVVVDRLTLNLTW
jgi:hypothetical protein